MDFTGKFLLHSVYVRVVVFLHYAAVNSILTFRDKLIYVKR